MVAFVLGLNGGDRLRFHQIPVDFTTQAWGLRHMRPMSSSKRPHWRAGPSNRKSVEETDKYCVWRGRGILRKDVISPIPVEC